MITLITILISILFITGVIVLIKLNENRKVIYSNINKLDLRKLESLIETEIIEEEQKLVKSLVSEDQEPELQNETEELRRRAVEKIAKLRNLSFNINAADPQNEFESVPAYLRRNMELHNNIADVESFYSNYTVKSDEKNQAEIETINKFLEGDQP
jgi:hypothetical protein